MAYNFTARADSSDDEPGVDLSAWKSAAARPATRQRISPSPPAPVAQMVADLEPSFTSFQAVNSSAPAVHERDDEVEMPEFPVDEEPHLVQQSLVSELGGEEVRSGGEEEEDNVQRDVTRLEAVELPRQQIHDDDILDFTFGEDVVRRVLRELHGRGGTVMYEVEFEDRHVEKVRFEHLLKHENGQEALAALEESPPTPEETPPTSELDRRRPRSKPKMSVTRPRAARQTRGAGFVNTVDAVSGGESEDELQASRRSVRSRKQPTSQYVAAEDDSEDEDEEQENGRGGSKRRTRQTGAPSGRQLRTRTHRADLDDSDREIIAGDLASSDDDQDDLFSLQSDLQGAKKRRRPLRIRGAIVHDHEEDGLGFDRSKRQRTGARQSGRSTRHVGGMAEVGEDNIYRSDSDDGTRAPAKPKVTGAKEAFKPLPRNDDFRMRHNQFCEVCSDGPNFAQLIYCQGCTLAYHKQCLGHRTNREHLVTKVGEGDFVLQCRRCVAFPRKKDHTAPDQSKCQDCKQHGASCSPFRRRKTPVQEQKDRDDNFGIDPIYEMPENRINNAESLMFRCINCWRGFHFEHLPSRNDMMDLDSEVDTEQRFREYSRDWKCKECSTMPAKISGLIAWKPVDEDMYDDALAYELIDEDEKAYLVKWDGMSYFRAAWMPGAWVWGVTAPTMRKAFAKKEEAQHPKMRTEEAIPEDYLRADIMLDIKFTSIVDIRTEEIDKARIREVDKALIKYKGLGYEDAVWEKPPGPEDGDRWSDFVTAYNDWVLGRYVRQPKAAALKSRLEKARSSDFAKLEKHAQPSNVEGGELMKYQIEGLNWLYYKWFTQKNAILADEMGLGKTIQVIGFLATLVQDWNCFPFLVVVPNSTCPNWRREIKRWAPSLRVVAYYGSKESRDLAYRHELYPEGSRDPRCHIVVTSYDAAADENCRKFFRSVSWQGLIVDEGQRLKSEKTQLYSALGALKAPFKVLLTGTPLQNNQRELFNLLQFLDDSYDAAALEEQYQDLNHQKISELHEMIRPFFLRRTKAQVLTFLPPMAQIILPVSMSIVQKTLYRTILAKNPDLMKAIFSSDATMGKNERASLSNILMQLRKCLCHPFVYNKSIEERVDDRSLTHRNLVDASSKLKLLELLLPKLKQRGHRVLIFSQFLDMLDIVEDFLDGMAMQYQRLDGSISSLQKQKRIDEFNSPESPLFAFLLSTRAGGVGINLATADTVIILDPDFNPHQDIQALSRAHRIGQHKKVLCFQLVTRASAEEKIMQIGRKKLALDHVLIQEMDDDGATENDLTSVLRHGASELFNDDGEQDITYDATDVERLLDRSHIENTRAGEDKNAETQWSNARVWANDHGTLEDGLVDSEEQAPDPGVWANILKERERIAAEEAAAKAEAFGRGRRVRNNVGYADDAPPEGAEGLNLTPVKNKKVKTGDDSDTDFQAEESEAESVGAEDGNLDGDDLDGIDGRNAKLDTGRKKTGKKTQFHLPTPAATPVKLSSAPSRHNKAPLVSVKAVSKASDIKVKKSANAPPKPKPTVTPRTPDMNIKESAHVKAKLELPPESAPNASASTVRKSAEPGKEEQLLAVFKLGNKAPASLMKEPVAELVDDKPRGKENVTPAANHSIDNDSSPSRKKQKTPRPKPTVQRRKRSNCCLQ